MRFSARFFAALWMLGLVALSVAHTAPPETVDADSPASHWKFTDRWNLVVDYFGSSSKENPSKPTATFPVEVMPVTDPEQTHMNDWTILRFTAKAQHPEDFRPPISAWILKRAGWLGKAAQMNPGEQLPVDKKILQIGYISVMLDPDLSLPVEMLFPNLTAQTLTDPSTGTKFELKREEKDGLIRMEATFRIPGKDEIRLNQTWGKGETWWRESTRYVNGRKIFHAQFVSYHSTAELEQRLRDDINLFLQNDDRLHVRLDFIRNNPKAQELLDAVQKATGVGLRVDPELRDYETPFGSVHFRNAPAWTVMKFIASQGFHNAQWERDAEGYRLKPYGALPPKPEENRSFLLIFLRHGGATFILLLLLGLTIWTRRRAK